MEPESKQRQLSSKAAGNTLLAVPFALVGFTAAMIQIPAERSSARPAQVLAERGVARGPDSAVEAASNDDLYLLGLLARSGVDMDAPSEDGTTPLMAAARANAAAAMRWLIRTSQVRLEPKDDAGLTAFAHAVTAGCVDRVEELVAAGAYPGASGKEGLPPIAIAASRDDIPMVQALVRLGERTGLAQAVDQAIGEGRLKTADALLGIQREHQAGGLAGQWAELAHDSVRHGDPETLSLMLRHGAPVTVADETSITPLGSAITVGRLDIADLLLAAGAPIESPCARQLVPLQFAWQRRDAAAAAFLLERGAVPHPALMVEAAELGEPRFVRLFARFGAPLDLPMDDGDTMLARALAAGDHSWGAELLAIGASPSVITKEGQPLLATTVARRDAAAVQLLLDAGADPNVALEHPVSEAFHELVDARDLSYYLRRDRRFTPIMVAAGTGDGDTIRALLAGGASKGKYTRSWKRYPISFASSAGHILAQQLLCGYDPAEQDDHYRIEIDLSEQRATLYKNGAPIDSSKVSTGKKGHRTPAGEYVVTHKHRHHTSTLYGAPMPYFMRLSCGAFGTHTGHCPGYPASHGCIRMPNHKAKAFFNTAPTGTPVSIVP